MKCTIYTPYPPPHLDGVDHALLLGGELHVEALLLLPVLAGLDHLTVLKLQLRHVHLTRDHARVNQRSYTNTKIMEIHSQYQNPKPIFHWKLATQLK